MKTKQDLTNKTNLKTKTCSTTLKYSRNSKKLGRRPKNTVRTHTRMRTCITHKHMHARRAPGLDQIGTFEKWSWFAKALTKNPFLILDVWL